MGGCGIRVPVPDGSLTDNMYYQRNTSVVEINELFKKAASGPLMILSYIEEPIVSVDILEISILCI